MDLALKSFPTSIIQLCNSIPSSKDPFPRGGRSWTHFHEDEGALTHIIEFSLALVILLFILAGYFTAVDNEFTFYSQDDTRRDERCYRYSDLLLGDTGLAETGEGNITAWEELSPDELQVNLTRPGLAAEGRPYGMISGSKILGFRNLTYLHIRSTLAITKRHFNFEITETDGTRIATFGYSDQGATKISTLERIVVLVENGSERTVKFIFRLFEGVNRRTLVRANEIMYHPEEGKGEWIELYNPSDEAVDLSTFGLYTQQDSTFDALRGDSLILPGKGYAVILDSEDTQGQYSIPSHALPVFVRDNNLGQGGLIDTEMDFSFQGESFRGHHYSYNNTMGGNGNGRSLEWSLEDGGWKGSTIQGGTPGKENSVV